jgi:hypothetical protein
MKKSNWLITVLIAALTTISTPSCAMSKKATDNTREQNTLNFKEYKTASELQSALQKFYPKGSNLTKVVDDLKLNKQSQINDNVNGNIILYRLYDGSKNFHGYNYWNVSIRINSENQIEQISVSSADYQGS